MSYSGMGQAGPLVQTCNTDHDCTAGNICCAMFGNQVCAPPQVCAIASGGQPPGGVAPAAPATGWELQLRQLCDAVGGTFQNGQCVPKGGQPAAPPGTPSMPPPAPSLPPPAAPPPPPPPPPAAPKKATVLGLPTNVAIGGALVLGFLGIYALKESR